MPDGRACCSPAGSALFNASAIKDMTSIQEYAIQTSVSGRYLLQLPSNSVPAPLLIGFHGYGQTAEDEIALLKAIPGSARWLCCSIEALHPVYTPRGETGASWMTSRAREQRITENVNYVDAVIKRIRESASVGDRVCFHGFSQGCGMACRAALLGSYRACGLMLLGGDIPPELSVNGGVDRVHLARGNEDRFYSPEKYEHDCARFRDAGLPFTATLFSGEHGANEEYCNAAGEFLATV